MTRSKLAKRLLTSTVLALAATACSSGTTPSDGGVDDSSTSVDSSDGGAGESGSDCLTANDCIDYCFNVDAGPGDAGVQSCVNDCCIQYNCPSAPDCFGDN